MANDNWLWVASVVAAMRDHTLTGRTRMQKTMKLLQRKRLPANYTYSIYFYGPYSEELQSDLGILDHLGIVRESQREMDDGTTFYIFSADPKYMDSRIKRFRHWIKAIEDADLIPLELAATYDAYREMGYAHQRALGSLRQKKIGKCTSRNLAQAFGLLRHLELPFE